MYTTNGEQIEIAVMEQAGVRCKPIKINLQEFHSTFKAEKFIIESHVAIFSFKILLDEKLWWNPSVFPFGKVDGVILFSERPAAHVLLAFKGQSPVGFAVYFYNFSTWLGRPGLYLEDLFVKPEHRAKGFGRALLVRLAKIALERNCGRMEWSVLDWNESAIKFYHSLGAKLMDERRVFRLTRNGMLELAGSEQLEQRRE